MLPVGDGKTQTPPLVLMLTMAEESSRREPKIILDFHSANYVKV